MQVAWNSHMKRFGLKGRAGGQDQAVVPQSQFPLPWCPVSPALWMWETLSVQHTKCYCFLGTSQRSTKMTNWMKMENINHSWRKTQGPSQDHSTHDLREELAPMICTWVLPMLLGTGRNFILFGSVTRLLPFVCFPSYIINILLLTLRETSVLCKCTSLLAGEERRRTHPSLN